MTDHDIDLKYFRKRLIAERDRLLGTAEAGKVAAETVELDQTRVGRLSRMDALQSQALGLEANRRRDQALREIGAALNRIEQDDYGYCLECGEVIASERLKVDPATRLCIDCARRAEDSR